MRRYADLVFEYVVVVVVVVVMNKSVTVSDRQRLCFSTTQLRCYVRWQGLHCDAAAQNYLSTVREHSVQNPTVMSVSLVLHYIILDAIGCLRFFSASTQS